MATSARLRAEEGTPEREVSDKKMTGTRQVRKDGERQARAREMQRERGLGWGAVHPGTPSPRPTVPTVPRVSCGGGNDTEMVYVF